MENKSGVSDRDSGMSNKKHIFFFITGLFCLSALVMLRQLISSAYFSCIIQDSFDYTSWAWQFTQALKEGVIYPRWLPLNFWGYGSPTFILYPPLAFYLVGLFNVFTGSVISAMNLTKFAALFLTGLGMFFLVKEFYSVKTALMTASFYIVFPYQIFQLYFTGGFTSVLSLMWFSPTVLFTWRYIKNKQYKDILYAGICYGGLILTHLLNAYMFAFVLTAFIFYTSVTQNRLRDLILIPSIIMIGLLISAAYIIPLIYEKQFINTRAFTIEGFNFANFFILPNLTSRLPSGSFWPVYYDIHLFFLFFFCSLIVLSFLRIVKFRQIKAPEGVYAVNVVFLFSGICSLFLLFGVSRTIWETVPFFKYIQFPMRWLNITTFAVVFLSAVLFTDIDVFHKKKRNNLFIVTLFLTCFLFDYKYINSAHLFTENELLPVKSINWNLVHLPVGVNIDEFDENNEDEEGSRIMKGEGKAIIATWRSAERVIEISAQTPLILRIRTFNFPGWHAYIDSVRTEIGTEGGTGAMLITIPQGDHTVVLRFEDTPVRYYAKIVSVISFFIMVLLVLIPKKAKRTSITGI